MMGMTGASSASISMPTTAHDSSSLMSSSGVCPMMHNGSSGGSETSPQEQEPMNFQEMFENDP